MYFEAMMLHWASNVFSRSLDIIFPATLIWMHTLSTTFRS